MIGNFPPPGWETGSRTADGRQREMEFYLQKSSSETVDEIFPTNQLDSLHCENRRSSFQLRHCPESAFVGLYSA
jgi:hypothetical protein